MVRQDNERSDERRRRRSHDPLVALHYQLSETRRQGSLDTIVVADGSGVVVAGAGSWAACEELAAFAPLIHGGTVSAMDVPSLRASAFGGPLDRVTVRSIDVGGDRVLLCARTTSASSDEGREHAMKHAALGISRILNAA